MLLAPVRRRTPEHVLLVEDHHDTRIMIQRLLRKNDYVVHAVSTGVEAFKLTWVVPCDIALLDIRLPDGSGMDLLGRLRTVSPIPAIACTAQVTRLEMQTYRSAGFDEVVMKPFQPEDLLAAVRRLLPTRLVPLASEPGSARSC
jgi:DNA-binding response OmpR family regulator